MQLRIEKIVYPGRSLGRTEGKIVFTDEGIPGELVEVEVLKDKKSYAEARTVEVIENSPERRPPICSHYRACSPYQIMGYDFELKIKEDQLGEIFYNTPGIDSLALELIPSPSVLHYRNKIRLSFNWNRQPPFLAYHEPGSLSNFLPVEKCHLVSEKANRVLEMMTVLLRGQPLPAIEHLEIRESFFTGELLIIFESRDEESLERAAELWVPALTLDNPVAGAVGILQEGRRKKFLRLYGRDFLEEKIRQTIFRYGAGSFFQVNPPAVEKVVERMEKYLQPLAPVKLADLYSGPGTFGLLLSDLASEILAVESDPGNVFYLKKNMRLNRIQHLIIAEGRSEELLEEVLDFNPQVLVVDPPRRGIASELAEALSRYPVSLLFYLSCNPATLARDLKILQSGYELREVTAFDFFPRTPHMEVLAVLQGRR